jgi:hypothetical protein
MLAPTYDIPQLAKTVQQGFEQAKLTVIESVQWGYLVGWGTKPA